jgi:hypothetical protein
VLRLDAMAKDYECPSCKSAVDRAATVCSNPSCRVELAFCSHCRDVTSYTLVVKRTGRLERDIFQCARCQKLGVKCFSWLVGGYCNGLARATESGGGRPLCAGCTSRATEISRSGLGWLLAASLGTWFRRRH